jgi:hypothetical protein
MAYHVEELPLYPPADLEAALNALPGAWTLKFVLDAVPVQLRQNKSKTENFISGGKEYTKISPTALFIFTE